MRSRLALPLLLVAALAMVGCSSPAPAPTVTVTAIEPAPTVTVTVTATPEAAAESGASVLDQLREVSELVTAAEETEPGRWEVNTQILDPGAGISGSAEAMTAIAICEKAVELGAAKVVVYDADGSTWILYGHPSYGDTCTEV